MHPDEVIHFWFEESRPTQWFTKDEQFDAEIRRRFGETYERAVRGETAYWRSTPEGRLAEVIVLDQFARNMFRNSAKAFAADAHALSLVEETIAAGDHRKLMRSQRRFLYMPFMHSESRAVHRRALWRFATLLPEHWRTLWYEWKHKRIIDRFGRYPHRNAILGRESTPAEIHFLKTNSGF